jgi:hypothetical protein
MTSLMAASMVLAPVIAGSLYEVNISLPYFLGAALMMACIYFEYRVWKIRPRDVISGKHGVGSA